MRFAIVVRSLVYLLAIGLVGWAAYLGWNQWRIRSTGDTIPPRQTINHSTATPSERQTPSPSDSNSYTVAADRPRAIDIPTVKAVGFIQPIGIDRQKHMAVPTNVAFAGWFVDSTPPGEAGLSIINGHVNGRYTAGIFRHLQKLQTGDIVRIQRGDLSWLTYRVTQKILFKATDSGPLFTRHTADKSELHLVTCGGPYNKVNRVYEQRVLVVATLVSS